MEAIMDFIPPPNLEPVAIYNDGGGLVEKYRMAAYQYKMEGRQVKILGSCRSACVLYLSVPKVCVGPNAVVKAHHAYEQATGVLRPDYTASMMRELPSNIREKLEPNITRSYNQSATLTYHELIALGVPDCRSMKPQKRDMVTVAQHRVKSVRTELTKPTKSLNPIAQLFGAIRSKFDGTP